jgi:AcrR family transcriptional regulator
MSHKRSRSDAASKTARKPPRMRAPRTMTNHSDTVQTTSRKSTQRERLITGMFAAVGRHGYAGTNVSHVIEHAGVSRPTFYEYFSDKDDCFITTHREAGRRLVEDLERTVAAAPPEQAVQRGVRRLVEIAQCLPDLARFLMNDTMAGGWRALDEHDRLRDEIAEIIERGRARASPDTPTPDVPIRLVMGAVRWLLAPKLRRGERGLTGVADELVDWVERYICPTSEHRWHTLDPGPALPPSPHVSQIALRPPPAIPPGRSKLSKGEIAHNQRERIVYATAEVAARKGYTVTRVADITSAAGVDRRVFYTHFADKQQAFLAVHELCVQQLLAVTASAFFSADVWPERAWEAMRAYTQFQSTHAIVAHIALVESHAVGAPAVQRIDDGRAAFMMFFQEGNQHASKPGSRGTTEACIGAIFELFYHQARQGRSDQLSRLNCNGAYLMLAPFLGPTAANEFIDGKLREAALETTSALA